MVVLEWLVAFSSENCTILGLVSVRGVFVTILFLTTAVNWSNRHKFVSLAV